MSNQDDWNLQFDRLLSLNSSCLIMSLINLFSK